MLLPDPPLTYIMETICERLRVSSLWHGVHYDIPIDTLWDRGPLPRVGVWDFSEDYDLAATGMWLNEVSVRVAVAFQFSEDEPQKSPRRIAHLCQDELERALTPTFGKSGLLTEDFDILPEGWVIQEVIEDGPEQVGLLWSSWQVRYHREIAA